MAVGSGVWVGAGVWVIVALGVWVGLGVRVGRSSEVAEAVGVVVSTSVGVAVGVFVRVGVGEERAGTWAGGVMGGVGVTRRLGPVGVGVGIGVSSRRSAASDEPSDWRSWMAWRIRLSETAGTAATRRSAL